MDDRYLNCAQDPWEMNELLALIRNRQIGAVLEIGTKAHGWVNTLFQWTAPGCDFVCVDVRAYYTDQRQQVMRNLALTGRDLRLIMGDSTDPKTVEKVRSARSGQYDLLHVDGDHSYESCRLDYENYSPLVRDGGLIVFHDVHHVRDTGVHAFWDELRRTVPARFARSWEFFHPRACRPDGDGPMGIGVIEVDRP